MSQSKIVVLGAGVSGLTTALLLSQAKHNVTVISKHMPGDYDIEYASPWAGANFLPFSSEGSPENKYERETWPALQKLACDSPDAGIHFQTTHSYRRDKDAETAAGKWTSSLSEDEPWFRELLPDCRPLRKDELLPGTDGGCCFTSVCINTAIYLPWLVSQCIKNGVTLRRGIAEHITDVAGMHASGEADIVVNCTGLSSMRLGGVEDKTMYPVRGQIVVVRNDPQLMATISGCDDSPEEAVYVMHRPAGGGCVLGGCIQRDSWESQPDHSLAIRIMKRCIELCPKLVPPGKGIEALSIIRHGVGLRPYRQGGIRIESETLDKPDGGKLMIVHNYGHGGYGYQTSYGCSQEVLKQVQAMTR